MRLRRIPPPLGRRALRHARALDGRVSRGLLLRSHAPFGAGGSDGVGDGCHSYQSLGCGGYETFFSGKTKLHKYLEQL